MVEMVQKDLQRIHFTHVSPVSLPHPSWEVFPILHRSPAVQSQQISGVSSQEGAEQE